MLKSDFTIDHINTQHSLQISRAKHKLVTDITCENMRKEYPLRRRTEPNIKQKINNSYYENNK